MFCIYLEESTHKAASRPHADIEPRTDIKPRADIDAGNPDISTETKQIVREEVAAKWNKFSAQELSALKDRDDLVTQVVSRYGIEKGEAQRDVDSVLKGRQI